MNRVLLTFTFFILLMSLFSVSFSIYSLSSVGFYTLNIYGSVDSQSGLPVSNAKIYVTAGSSSTSPGVGYPNYCTVVQFPPATYTDSNGNYKLNNFGIITSEKCSLELISEKNGYLKKIDVIVISPSGNTININHHVTLSPNIKIIAKDNAGKLVNRGYITLLGQSTKYYFHNGVAYLPIPYTSNTLYAKYVDSSNYYKEKNFEINMLPNKQTIVNLEIFITNDKPPIIDLISPTTYSNGINPKFVFKVSDDYSNNLSCALKLDGNLLFTGVINNNTVTTEDYTHTLSEGSHTWSVSCTDNAGQTTTKSDNFIVDRTPPQISFNPNSFDWTNKTVSVTITATDANTVSKIYYKVVQSTQSCPLSGYTEVDNNNVNIKLPNTGIWKICAYGVDEFNNIGSPISSGLYRIDKIKPSITLSANTYCTNGNVEISSNVNDLNSGLSNFYLYENGGLVKSSSLSGNSGHVTYSTTISKTSTFKAIISDVAGNLNNKSITIEFDDMGPTQPTIITYPKYVKTGSVTEFKWSQSIDNGCAGFSHYIVKIISPDGSIKVYSTTAQQFSFVASEPGYYTISVAGVDVFGNIGEYSNPVKIFSDNVKPTIILTTNQYWNKTPISVKYTFSDNAMLSNYTLYLNNNVVSKGTLSGDTSSGIFNIIPSNGINILKVIVDDFVGNTNSKTLTFCYDTQAPTLTLNTPIISGTTVKLSWNANDNGCSGINYYVLYVDGVKKYNGTDDTYTINTDSGIHTWKVIAYDKAGNSKSELGSFVVDTQAPVVTLISPTDYVNKTTVEFKFKATDDYSTSMSCRLYIDGNGVTTLTVQNDTVTTYTYTLSEGNHDWKVACKDNAQNVGTATTGFILDITPPVTTANAPKGWVNHPVTVTLSASDNLAGVKATYYKIDGGSWNQYSRGITISSGVHTIDYYSVDNAGNSELPKSVEVKVDTQAPSISFKPNSQTWTNNNIPVTVSASDSGSGVKALYYDVIDSSANCPAVGDVSYHLVTSASTTVTISNNGQYKICAYAVDNVDNKPSSASASGTYQIDKVAPTVSFSPDSDISNSQIQVTITGHDTGSGVKEIYYKIINPTDSCGTNGYNSISGSRATVQIDNYGKWKICAYAVDNAGNDGSVNVSNVYTFDNKSPEVTVTNPADGTYFNVNDVTVNWTGSDELSGIAYYNISVNGHVTQLDKDINSYKLIGLSDGNYLVKVIAVDNAGNVNESDVNFVIDTTKPTISITSPSDGSVHTGHTIKIVWGANDQNMDHFDIYLNGKLNATLPATATSYTFNLNDGQYTVKVVAVDKAGNENSASVSFIIDNAAPTVNFVGPNDWTIENFNIEFKVNDIEPKVNCKVSFDGIQLYDKDTIGDVKIPLSNIAGGDHSLNITCTDAAGFKTEVDKIIKVDNTTPQIISISPTGSIEVGGFVVTVNATDTFSGVNKVIAEFGGHTYIMDKVGGKYQVQLYNGVTGTFNLIIKVYDKAGHVTSDSTTLTFYKKSTSGSTGGGFVGGGSCTINGYKCTVNSDCCSGYCNAGICTSRPVDVKLSLNVQPEFQTIFDKDSAKFTFIVSNSGKDIARDVVISVSGINGTLSDTKFTLSAGTEKAIYFITKLPAGEYNGTVTVKFGNQTITKDISLKVTSYQKYEEQQYAKDVCSNASMHIVDLAANGMNVTGLYAKYDKAIQLMSAGNYSEAGKLCNEVANATPQVNAPTIAPFFIAVANGIKANAAYVGLSVALLASVAIWLKRTAIITYFRMRRFR